MKRLHVIPVPDGMTVDDAFAEIMFCGELMEGRTVSDDGTGGCWAVVEVDIEDDHF